MILIIDTSLKDASVVSDIFHYMGVLSHAVTPEGAVREISARYRAIIISDPERLREPDALIKSIKGLPFRIPIFAMCKSCEEFRRDDPHRYYLFDDVFSDNTYSSSVYHDIIDYQSKNGMPILGEYLLAGIDVSAFGTPSLFGEELKLTKTECMILRYIIRSYPVPASPRDILRYAFRPSRTPEISNIRTHISSINRKLRESGSDIKIISEPRLGYTVPTFEYLTEKKPSLAAK